MTKVAHTHKSTTHEEMFFHIREPFKFQDKDMRGGTVFFRKENGRWFYSTSHCSANDNWSKRVGRNIARRRYFASIRHMAHGLTAQDVPSFGQAQKVLRET